MRSELFVREGNREGKLPPDGEDDDDANDSVG